MTAERKNHILLKQPCLSAQAFPQIATAFGGELRQADPPPKSSGVYVHALSGGAVYVGKATNLRRRLRDEVQWVGDDRQTIPFCRVLGDRGTRTRAEDHQVLYFLHQEPGYAEACLIHLCRLSGGHLPLNASGNHPGGSRHTSVGNAVRMLSELDTSDTVDVSLRVPTPARVTTYARLAGVRLRPRGVSEMEGPGIALLVKGGGVLDIRGFECARSFRCVLEEAPEGSSWTRSTRVASPDLREDVSEAVITEDQGDDLLAAWDYFSLAPNDEPGDDPLGPFLSPDWLGCATKRVLNAAAEQRKARTPTQLRSVLCRAAAHDDAHLPLGATTAWASGTTGNLLGWAIAAASKGATP